VANDYPAEHTLPFGTPQKPRASARPVTSRSAKLPRTGISPAELPAPANHGVPQTMPEAMQAAVMPVVNGDTSKLFGRYKILERLGVGGMSEVYTGVAHGAEGFSRTFVIKRLKPELARNKEAVAQFIDEARVQASLVHSNIVPVFDFGMMGGEYFMIEEYILGRDLARISTRCVERTGFRLEPRMVYYYAHEALQALGYAHTKRGRDGEALDIVHRDVSATNVMVSSSGEVKLFDFGIAKANKRNTQTQAGMVKGNANFMSPEQARGQNVDSRSDLFSLALVMYFCFTNQLLYTGDNDLDILYRAACGPTAEDLERILQLPPPAADILQKALSVDPADRYQTAEEFAAALAPHATGMKPEAASLMELLFGDELRTEAA
jgi:serine/threonine-protein kinase